MNNSRITRYVHKLYNHCLYQIFRFGEWHLIPYEDKEYAQDIVQQLNKYLEGINEDGYIVEVGCGLGDIIKRIKWDKKAGYDVSANVLKAARFICRDVLYETGSFEKVHQKYINCFIMVNFIHGIRPEALKAEIQELLKKSQVNMFVIDRLINIKNTPYKFSHVGGDYLRTMNAFGVADFTKQQEELLE